MIKFLSKFKLLTITLISISTISVSSISHAHSHQSQVNVQYQPRIEVRPIARVQNKLLPQELYVQTTGHTFRRKFALQNKIIKHVYYDASQPTHKLYAQLVPINDSTKYASSYWP
tara:strand:+ start:1181 stop:1525 length:345 start_codon:yes stop_codon:yes gene_type:complete